MLISSPSGIEGAHAHHLHLGPPCHSCARCGLSSCGPPPVQSVSRPLRHLVAYGSTNKCRPLKKSRASGSTAKMPTQVVYLPVPTATMLTMTATMKAIHSQRCLPDPFVPV